MSPADRTMQLLKSAMLPLKVTPGELFDRLTILRIKTERVQDAKKRDQAALEVKAIENYIYNDSAPHDLPIDEHVQALKSCNETLWRIEDDIRAMDERIFGKAHWCGNCGENEGSRVDSEDVREYCHLARSVYITNDQRSRCKANIDRACGIKPEVKEYAEYKT